MLFGVHLYRVFLFFSFVCVCGVHVAIGFFGVTTWMFSRVGFRRALREAFQGPRSSTSL